jgi:hypothetical protein
MSPRKKRKNRSPSFIDDSGDSADEQSSPGFDDDYTEYVLINPPTTFYYLSQACVLS